MFIGVAAGALLTGHPLGMFAGFVLPLIIGVTQQHWRPKLKRRPRLAPVTIEGPADRGGECFVGTARELEHRMTSPLAGSACLAAHTTVRAKGANGVFFRHARFCDWLLTTDDGERVVVAGEQWLVPTGGEPEPLATGLIPPLAGALLSGPAVADETILEAGDRVEIRGRAARELLPAGDAYRDGEALVVRGVAGAPVAIRLLRAR